MKSLFLLFILIIVLYEAAARIHSMKYFYTGSSQVPNFPEFVIVGLVDDLQMVYYDSITMKTELKQEWMNKVTADDPQYLERNTGNFLGSQQTFKAGIEILKPRFNQTGGVHIYQWMYGCEWDDETGQTDGYDQFGYDGEDFISLDLKTGTWIASTPQAVITKYKWARNTAYTDYWKNYISQQCPDWIKKYVNYGRSSLMRTDRPTVSFLQKSPTAPVTCHATGFYPDRAAMHWKKDGVEIHDNVDMGEILPNNDGTFQMSIDLSSIPPEEWEKYECVFELSGVDDIVTRLRNVRSNLDKPGTEGDPFPTGAVIGVVVGLLLLICIIGVVIWRRRNNEGFKRANTSDTSSDPDLRVYT
ncbi:major histocompatibility complex class I-related gene protein-like [Sphaeramia orbicularis]|uniref:Major histocompatibility complex class I-related gene protein-like n=1 Tax=Sphaeramia orbicularis TaxID=375764 RepID=A0A672YR46_9TELE|nr:major histocompatibility complex class I-related gene protein-like [Sphaeramia orbicularis]